MEFDRKALSLMQATAERYYDNLSDEAIHYLFCRGIDRPVASRFLLGTCDDVHEGWLSIPYLRASGVVGIKFRRLDDGKPKYIGHGRPHLYNTADFDIADQTGEIAICEGELDALTASALCGVPCVGIPGATQWAGNPHWRELFVGYQRVWVLADPDEAGLKLASQILEDLPAARLVKLPADVNETVVKLGHDLKEFMK